jgi:hypothetical protein
MTTISSIRLFAIIFLVFLVSCDKEESKIDKVLDWTEYTDYIPLPEKDAIWINEVTSEEIPEIGPVAYKFRTVTNQYYINGDTSINNLLYKKVFNKRIIYTEDVSVKNETKYSMTVYSGGLRQNITDKKVYFIFASDNNERLLYDFDLEIGDSIYFYTTREQKGKISCIDSTLVGNRYHNVYYVQIGGILNSFHYMEGIGFSNGLIIEPDESLNGPRDVDFVEFKYKNEKIDIDWNNNTENCFD